jgi:hypothetical protein
VAKQRLVAVPAVVSSVDGEDVVLEESGERVIAVGAACHFQNMPANPPRHAGACAAHF